MNETAIPNNLKEKLSKYFLALKKETSAKFPFLNIDEEKEEELFQNALNSFLEKENEINLDILVKKLSNYLNKEYTSYLIKILNESDNKQILKDYTDFFFSNNTKNSPEDTLTEYTNCLLSYMPNISYEDCLYLSENKFIKKAFLELIYLPNNQLNEEKIQDLLQTDISILLEPFCTNNNIYLDKDDLTDEDSYFDDITLPDPKKVNDTYFTDNILIDYLNNLPDIFTPEERKYYFKRLAEGDETAKKEIIEHNLKFVVKVAKRYQNKGLPLIDLIQEGNIGLIKAVDRFDPNRPNEFLTYAQWWIKQAITRAIYSTGRTIRLPVHVNTKLSKIMRLQLNLSDTYGHEVTNKELAEKLNMSKEELEKFLSETSDCISYDVNVTDNNNDVDSSELIDFIPDDNTNIEENYIKGDLKEHMLPSLDKLKPRERYIIIERIVNKKPLSYVSKKLNISRERVRQIEIKTLQKLKDDKIMQTNMNYLDNPEKVNVFQKEAFSIFKAVGGKKDCVLEAISYLDKEEKVYLHKIYGQNYKNKVEIGHSKELDEIITKLKIFTSTLKRMSQANIIDQSLCHILQISEEELTEKLNILSNKDRKLLDEKYANGFSNPPTKTFPLPIEEYITRKIIRSLFQEIDSKQKNLFNKNNIITKNSLKEAFSHLTPEEQEFLKNCKSSCDKEQKYFLKKYNNSSEEQYYLDRIRNASENIIFQKLITYANNIENSGYYNIDINEVDFLSLTSAKNVEELKYHLTKLTSNELTLLKDRFGNNFLAKKIVKNLEYNKKRKIITQIIPKINLNASKMQNKIEEVLTNDKAIIKEAISYFNDKDKKFLEAFLFSNQEYLTESNYKRLNEILLPALTLAIRNLKDNGELTRNTTEKIINLSRSNANIKLFFNIKLDDLKEILASLSPKEQELFYKKFGSNLNQNNILTPEENKLYKSLYLKIRRLIRFQQKTILQKDDLENIKNIYLNLNPETRNQLSIEERALLDNIFLTDNFNELNNTNSRKEFLQALKNILLLSNKSNIKEANKIYLKSIISYINNEKF